MRPAILIDKTDASFSESFAEYGTVLQMQKKSADKCNGFIHSFNYSMDFLFLSRKKKSFVILSAVFFFFPL